MNSKQILIFLAIFGYAAANKIIESPHTTNWGEWGNWERCGFGKYAQAVQLKTEPYQGLTSDDTAANAIRLYCGDPYNATTPFINSTEGSWGNWGSVFACRSDNRPLPPDGYITGFQLRVESQTVGDNTATNNIRVVCTYPGTVPVQTLEADGLTYGSWSALQVCNTNQRVCAIQTQVEKYQGDSDDTALNNVALECCDV